MAAPDLLCAGPAHLETGDGVLLSTRVHRAPGDAVATVVLVHGFTASKDDPTVVALAGALAAAGFDVIAYDGRGHGASGGVCTLGDDERHDVARAVGYAQGFGRPVVAVGGSMGAIAVLRHAVDDPDLAGVVTVSCPARWRLHGPRSLLSAAMTRTTGASRECAWPGRGPARRRPNGWSSASPVPWPSCTGAPTGGSRSARPSGSTPTPLGRASTW